MQHSIGEIIRQVRRQRNLTQTELGGERYSKSYVSAVERNKIISSQDALRYFAEQLGQYDNYFVELLDETAANVPVVEDDSRTDRFQQLNQAQTEAVDLLDMLLENTDLSQLSIRRSIPVLSPDLVEALPRQKQFRFYFLMGLSLREQGDRDSARRALEYALALAPAKQQPAILDELGFYYVAEHAHHTALMYFTRALSLLQDDTLDTYDTGDASVALTFKIRLHCAESYQALGLYENAITYYEQARQHLRSDHGLRTAALLYLGLGYCTCTAIQQKAALAASSHERIPAATQDEIEMAFRGGVSYLIQSRNVFQVTDDIVGDTQVRLTLAFMLLDFCEQRRNFARPRPGDANVSNEKKCIPLLEDAEEQCRQVLLDWQKRRGDVVSTPQQTDIVAVACACLVRIAVQRALLACEENYKETTAREIDTAMYLCTQMLNIFKTPDELWLLVSNMMSVSQLALRQNATSLLREMAIPRVEEHNPLPLTEVYLALGATAEAMGRISTANDYSNECYAQATRWFDSALTHARQAVTDHKVDSGYLPRCFQQCASYLEARMHSASNFPEDISIALLNVLRITLNSMPIPNP